MQLMKGAMITSLQYVDSCSFPRACTVGLLGGTGSFESLRIQSRGSSSNNTGFGTTSVQI